ncbi:CDG_1a_G0040890.mRNA.1.CDS.1 [Saccharomyces cerevisiae]|nr:CDG_1a_G0040890.mRNA.1.CDS.1 [Saccharomyces cerevisiae]CAI4688255.1 BBL_G0040420.mRNA.1.CDS.1 [Saccharomyces cerevisiae]CAI7266565.1 BBL_G0040420.mRNA.1.CDS.1 [Saccharomyces cerevisiae]CAI7425194.1 CDG_1a_G0040890.mRNA.1.CDS.1 [Saccharomyces cerevisiae]
MASVTEQFNDIISLYSTKLEHTSLRQDSPEYQGLLLSTIKKLLNLKTAIFDRLALFSTNETIDDVSTASIKFLAVDYYLGLLISRRQSNDSDVAQRQSMKLIYLKKSVESFINFLTLLQDYKLLDPLVGEKLGNFKDRYNPQLSELYAQPKNDKDLSGAQLKRKEKIELFQRNKEITTKLHCLELELKNNDEDHDHDELLRELYLMRLHHFSLDTINNIEQNLFECEMLSNFLKNSVHEVKSSGTQIRKESNDDDSTGFTDKLENINKPLIDKKGQVLRNFTLVDKRQQLQQKVRGYGQYGPTMSVEEFLDKEFEEGRVLQGGEEPEQAPDEENMDWQDRETYKAREWDEFKESHAKGSGNTMNRG